MINDKLCGDRAVNVYYWSLVYMLYDRGRKREQHRRVLAVLQLIRQEGAVSLKMLSIITHTHTLTDAHTCSHTHTHTHTHALTSLEVPNVS